MVGTSMACQEWEGRILATVGDDIVIILLGELVPRRAQIWKDTAKGVSIGSATRWGYGISCDCMHAVGHCWAVWGLLIRVVVEILKFVTLCVVVLVEVQGVGEKNNIGLLDIDAVVHGLVFQSDARQRLRKFHVFGNVLP